MKKLLLSLGMLVAFSTNAFSWELKTQVDDMTGSKQHFIFSDRVKPNKALGFPYSNPTVYMYFDCQSELFVMRNTANNLLGMTPQSGDYSTGFTRVKTDGEILMINLVQNWGSEFITLDTQYTSHNLSKVKKEIVVELNHYSSGNRLYKFNMSNFDITKCPGMNEFGINQSSTQPDFIENVDGLNKDLSNGYVAIMHKKTKEINIYTKQEWNDEYEWVFKDVMDILVKWEGEDYADAMEELRILKKKIN